MSQSSALIREPIPCGTDEDVTAGRWATQMGWYGWVGSHVCSEGDHSCLDVGAGLCNGLRALRSTGMRPVVGIDTDERLQGRDALLVIGDVGEVPSRSFDVVTAIDVIEHVVEDRTFLYHLRRVARHAVYVTTPNCVRDMRVEGNHHHCRAYTPELFQEYFGYMVQGPIVMYGGTPDGSLVRNMHIHPLMADGEPWPHFCAVMEVER